MRTPSSSQAGFTLIEVAIGMVILVFVYLAMLNGFKFISEHSVRTNEKTFAAQKAVQMMEELRGLIENSNDVSIKTLDDYDDGISTKTVLTTKLEVTDPKDPVSGNIDLKFARRISILTMPNEPLARKVYVRVYRLSDMEVLAETMCILRTTVAQDVPTQNYDLYILALENVPGWWSALSTLKPTFDSVLSDIQVRNPNLAIRAHWITRLGYGRDPFYSPYINSSIRSDLLTSATMYVYYYPGNVDGHDDGVDFNYYVAGNMSGRYILDGTTMPAQNTVYTNIGEYGGSMADQFNATVRYPDEAYLYACATAAALAQGMAQPEISLRMLYEKMNSSPDDVRNLMIVNLHGELVPLPPMRNYSDPARSPVNNSSVCVVAHPENLKYTSGSQVNLRVHSFVTNPDSWADTSSLSSMSVLIQSTQIVRTNIKVRKLTGNGTVAYAWQNAAYGFGNDYSITYPTVSFRGNITTGTLITLYNSPLRHGANSTKGLASGERLYDYEYIPCRVDTAPVAFTEGHRDLTFGSSSRPKNTARWVIQLGTYAPLQNGEWCFETRIGSNTTTGSATNQPTNMSRSYFWIGATPPFTEQYQYIGDPRHMPYADLKSTDAYNWYFEDFDETDWQSYNDNDRWSSAINFDLPRYNQLIRTGLMNSGGLWNSITGFSFYYYGIGGEIGYDASNDFTNSLQIIRTPWDPTSTAVVGVDEITDGQTENQPRLIARTDNTWWGRYWIGELYPDYMYSAWSSSGNLPIGTGKFYRAEYDEVTSGLSEPLKRSGPPGCASFFNGNPTKGNANWFMHSGSGNTATITSTGTAIGTDFNFPLMSTMDSPRPFRLDDNGSGSPEWSTSPYPSLRTTLSVQEMIYESDYQSTNYDASDVIRVSSSNVAVARLVMNGLAPQGDFGSAQIGKLCIVSMLRGFLTAGLPGTTGRITQVPLVTVSSPSATAEIVNPTGISVVWTSTWTRWDGQKYTDSYPPNFSNTTSTAPLVFNVKYSNDNGSHWYFCQDNSATSAGARGGSFYTITAPFQYDWDLSNTAMFPQGSYLIRVECYRRDLTLHYTHHQVRIYIKR